MVKLHLAPDLALPLDAVTQTFAVLAVRGAGKSNTAAVLAEEMFGARLPFVVVDPVGAWYGLRSSQEGTGPGLAIPIFGGRRGDVPLERTGGALLADLVVDDRLSCVLDTSELSEGDKVRFLTEFGERLYRRNTEPLHLFLEEADDYLPQRPFREQARCLGAWERIVRRGRARGLGITMISQRSAALNKMVLTQIETLFVMRTTSPQDRKAIEAWVEYHGQSEEILGSLASLEDGEAWVWSPHWLKTTRRVRIRRRSTFDSAATPRTLHGARPPATLADVDLGAIRTRMAATIERAKADDPRELRRQLAEARAALAKAERAKVPPPAAAKARRVEIPVWKDSQLARLEAEGKRARELGERLLAHGQALLEESRQARGAMAASAVSPRVAAVRAAQAGLDPSRALRQPTAVMVSRRSSPAIATTSGLTGPQRKLLTALAQHGARLTRALALLTGYAHSGGAFKNPLSALRSLGYAEGRDSVAITEAGLTALGTWEPLPTGSALLAWWLGHLPGPDSKLLRAVAGAFPKAIAAEDVAHATGYEVTGGAFKNPLSRLRTLGLVVGRGELQLADELVD